MVTKLPSITADQLQRLQQFYDAAPVESKWAGRQYRKLLAHYYRLWIPPDASVLEIGCGSGELLALLPNRDVTGIDVSRRQIESARRRLPHGKFFEMAAEDLDLDRTFDTIIMSDTINFASDVQRILERLHGVAHRRTRLFLNFHSNLWRPVFAVATALRLKARAPASSWFTREDVRNLLWLGNWLVIQEQPRVLTPIQFPGFGTLLNRWLAPIFSWACLAVYTVARPQSDRFAGVYKVSVVIPARNEAGNIEAAVQRIPELGAGTEIIFIEGHSKDNTWAEILRVQRAYPELRITAMRQTKEGKGNAVREAFEVSRGDILMILDADLTVPPEELPKFYEALASGRADFVNGVRLVYPIEEQAMQFFNLCANKVFSMIFTWLLGQPVKDTLCGTKVLFRRDYDRIAANRAYFGDFDPFGDFDLLFGAGKLNLKIIDIPIRYQSRTYGETNIRRWRHGLLLLRMVFFGASKLKFI